LLAPQNTSWAPKRIEHEDDSVSRLAPAISFVVQTDHARTVFHRTDEATRDGSAGFHRRRQLVHSTWPPWSAAGSNFDYWHPLGVLIVILVGASSIFIMANLNENMMLPPELMNLHMQHWLRDRNITTRKALIT
jgi:hypothetical protein